MSRVGLQLPCSARASAARSGTSDLAAHIQALREADETEAAKRQFQVILDEVEPFRNRTADRPSPVFRLIRGGKEEL